MNENIIAQDSEHIIACAIMMFGSLGCAAQYLVSGSLGIRGVGIIKELKLSPQILIVDCSWATLRPRLHDFQLLLLQCAIMLGGEL